MAPQEGYALSSPQARLITGVTLSVLLVFLVLGGQQLWHLLTVKRVSLEELFPDQEFAVDGHEVRGWRSVKRWTSPWVFHGRNVAYYLENSVKAWDGFYEDGKLVQETVWNFDGTIHNQLIFLYLGNRRIGMKIISSPPWLLGAQDQSRTGKP